MGRAVITDHIATLTSAVVRSSGSFIIPSALLLAIAALDWLQFSSAHPVWVTALLDEPAHLATAGLALLAVAGSRLLARHPAFVLGALLGSVAIDVDHIPVYVGIVHLVEVGRPYSHSVTSVILLTLLSLLFRGRASCWLGAASGVLFHLVRDVATGPGVAFLWPISSTEFRAPYLAYAGLLVVLTAVATGRAVSSARNLDPTGAQSAATPQR